MYEPSVHDFFLMSSEAKNLEAISKAIDKHNDGCPFPAVEIRMNPFELERLGWDEIRGLPLIGDPELSTGRFRIICANEKLEDKDSSIKGRELIPI